MAEIFRDGFNGTPGDDLTTYNPSWVRQPGLTAAFQIGPDGQSIATAVSTSTAGYFRSDITPPNADYFVSIDVSLLQTLANAAAVGVINRASSTAVTHYQFRFLATSVPPNGSWQLRRIINNTAITLATVSGTFDAGELHNLKIGTSGANVSGYLDNNPIPLLGPSASTISDTGYGGVLGTNAPNNRARFDNFVIDNGLAEGQPGNATVTGVAANPATGQVAASGAATTAVTGVRANPAAGLVVATGQATAAVQGAAANPQVGMAAASGAARATVVGVSASPAAGDVTASSGGGAVVTGAAANPGAGQVTASGAARAIVIGVAADPGAAAVPASGAANVVVIGVAANPAAGGVTIELIDGPGEGIDATLVPASRIVVFEGSKRIVAFEGGKRVVTFEGGNRIVRFE